MYYFTQKCVTLWSFKECVIIFSCSPLDVSLSESSVSLERDSASDDECALRPTTPTDQSEAICREDGDGYLQTKAGVAEAALQDGE